MVDENFLKCWVEHKIDGRNIIFYECKGYIYNINGQDNNTKVFVITKTYINTIEDGAIDNTDYDKVGNVDTFYLIVDNNESVLLSEEYFDLNYIGIYEKLFDIELDSYPIIYEIQDVEEDLSFIDFLRYFVNKELSINTNSINRLPMKILDNWDSMMDHIKDKTIEIIKVYNEPEYEFNFEYWTIDNGEKFTLREEKELEYKNAFSEELTVYELDGDIMTFGFKKVDEK